MKSGNWFKSYWERKMADVAARHTNMIYEIDVLTAVNDNDFLECDAMCSGGGTYLLKYVESHPRKP
jgi:hypothetical protein